MICDLLKSNMAADVMAPGFWEIGAYKHNVNRLKDGVRQLDDYAKMIKERAEIEAQYARALQQYSDKWKNNVERSVPAGSVKTAWTEVLNEASGLSEQHNRVRERLIGEIYNTLVSYRKENIHVSAFRGNKEIHEIQDGFEKAQKQWKKLYEKMESSRKAYYMACRQERSAQVNLQNCQADTSVSQDGAQKLRDRWEKSKEEVHKTEINYKKYLGELDSYKQAYVENMSVHFGKCQASEEKRSKFFLEITSSTEKVLIELLNSPKFIGLHNQVENTLAHLGQATIQNDLKQWSAVNGVDAPTIWPAFEEYTPEMRTIANSKGAGKAVETGGVVLTRQIVKNEDAPLPGPASSANSDHGKGSSDSDTSTYDSRKTGENRYNAMSSKWNGDEHRASLESPPLFSNTPDSAKYGDFHDDFQGTHVVKSHATVLYDYNPVETDEIQLKKGETIEVLSEPDSLGWCTGRRNGATGLFPASYVQVN